jgi:hypothetical protein
VVALTSATTLVQEIVHRNPAGRAFQMIKAIIGLATIVILPTVMIAWARKNYRP